MPSIVAIKVWDKHLNPVAYVFCIDQCYQKHGQGHRPCQHQSPNVTRVALNLVALSMPRKLFETFKITSRRKNRNTQGRASALKMSHAQSFGLWLYKLGPMWLVNDRCATPLASIASCVPLPLPFRCRLSW